MKAKVKKWLLVALVTIGIIVILFLLGICGWQMPIL